MGRIIVITSGKGGVGKTTSCANLGVALALEQHSVALVDTDIGLRNLDVAMGLEPLVVYDLVDVAEGACKLKQALVTDPRFPTLALLPAAQTRDKGTLTPGAMRTIIRELGSFYDYVLIDCPAGIGHGFQNAIAAAEEAIVVANPDVSSIHDADRIIGLLAASGLAAPRLIINRTRPAMVKRGDMMTSEDILVLLGIELLGVVPDDEAVLRGGNLGEVVVTGESPAAAAYRGIAARLLGREAREAEAPRGAKRWWARFFTRAAAEG